MTNFRTFKKIVALVAAIALVVCFAVSASAIQVVTRTTYTNDAKTEINVAVNVTEIAGADYATYYATNGAKTVYVDQAEVSDAGAASFNFNTDATDLKSTVKIGYTGNTGAAKAEDISGYTISCVIAGKADYTKNVATGAEGTLDAYTATFAYACDSGKTVDLDAITATNAVVGAAVYEASTLTVPLTNITGDVVITVAEESTVVIEATPSLTTSGAINVTEDVKGEDAVGDRRVTVIGTATGKDVAEYGVIVTTGAITAGEGLDNLDAYSGKTYKAQGKAVNGLFAVQLVDQTAADAQDAILVPGTTYNVAVYVKDTENKYTISASGTCAIAALN